MDNVAVPMLLNRHPDWTDRQIMGEAARVVNIRMSSIGTWQQAVNNPYADTWARVALISVNEQQSWVAQLFEALPIPRNTSWQFFLDGWASTFFWGGIFAAVLAGANQLRDGWDTEEYTDTLGRAYGIGQERAWGPFALSEEAPLGVDFSPEFLRPPVPVGEGRGGRRLRVDWMEQADTPFRILNPYQYITSRASVPARAVDNLITGETFFGEPLDTLYKRAIVQPLLDIAPIPVESAMQASRNWSPFMEQVVPEGEGRLGAQGQFMQALSGMNLSAETNAQMLARAAGDIGLPTDTSMLEPYQYRLAAARRDVLGGAEIVQSTQTAAERGQDWARSQAAMHTLREEHRQALDNLAVRAEQAPRQGSRWLARAAGVNAGQAAWRIVSDYHKADAEYAQRADQTRRVLGNNEFEPEGEREIALDMYHQLYEMAQDDLGVVDGEVYRQLREDFMANQPFDVQQYILRNTNMTPLPPVLLQFFAEHAPDEYARIMASEQARQAHQTRQ